MSQSLNPRVSLYRNPFFESPCSEYRAAPVRAAHVAILYHHQIKPIYHLNLCRWLLPTCICDRKLSGKLMRRPVEFFLARSKQRLDQLNQRESLETALLFVSLEQQNVRLRCVCFVMLPSQTLGDAQPSPFLLQQNSQRAGFGIEVVSGDCLEHVLGQHNVSVFVRVVAVSCRVVDCLLELLQSRSF